VASIVVCSEPGSWQQASRFAEKVLGDAELKSFEDLRRRAPVQPLLVFLTTTDYHSLRSLLRTLKPASPDVVIYYANRLAPQDAASSVNSSARRVPITRAFCLRRKLRRPRC
jgi:hypothetical protein